VAYVVSTVAFNLYWCVPTEGDRKDVYPSALQIAMHVVECARLASIATCPEECTPRIIPLLFTCPDLGFGVKRPTQP